MYHEKKGAPGRMPLKARKEEADVQKRESFVFALPHPQSLVMVGRSV